MGDEERLAALLSALRAPALTFPDRLVRLLIHVREAPSDGRRLGLLWRDASDFYCASDICAQALGIKRNTVCRNLRDHGFRKRKGIRSPGIFPSQCTVWHHSALTRSCDEGAARLTPWVGGGGRKGSERERAELAARLFPPSGAGPAQPEACVKAPDSPPAHFDDSDAVTSGDELFTTQSGFGTS
jgi:hypothetical protein